MIAMSNKRLGEIAIQEIRSSMRGLSGKPAKQQAVRMAGLHGVSWKRIYELTKDLRPGRKPRADKGKRTYELVPGTDIWKAAQLVVHDKLDPDQALLTCKVRDITQVPSLGYFQRMLRENGLGRKSRRNPKRAHRRFEAEFPGDLFQIDVTALKVRWQDERTRRILRIEGVDKNHPDPGEDKVRVWQIMLVDDFSRRVFVRYLTTRAVTSTDMVRFECEAFSELGIPKKLYTDNGSEFKGRHIHAEKILNSVLKDEGGYRHERHKPDNPQATGKVENAHQFAEKMDRFVGLAVTEGQIVTADDLNLFAGRVCEWKNLAKHRTTGEAPMARWHSKRVVVRKLPADVIESALLSDVFRVTLDPSMTVARDGKAYKIPGVQPFVDYIGQKVTVVVPPNIDLILVELPNGTEYEVEKVLATADTAGEFRSTAESNAETLTKQLKASRKEEVKAIKAKRKQTGEIMPVPHFNVVIEQPATNVASFPQAERIVPLEQIAAVTPIVSLEAGSPASNAGSTPPEYSGKDINYWEAVDEFKSRFENIDEAKGFLLELFPGTSGTTPFSKVEDAVNNRNADTLVRTPLRKVS